MEGVAMTADNVPIRNGLRVWTNDIETGTIDLNRSWWENGELWFDVKLDKGGSRLQSATRVATALWDGRKA